MRYIISSALSILPLSMLPFSALAEVPRVVVDIPPVYGLVAQVMGDLGQPILLLDKGAGAHNFQLRPSQMGDIASADVIVWIGPQMTPWLERALGGAPEAASSLTLLDVSGTHTLDFAAQVHQEGHAEHDHDHDHEGTDPHAWLSPKNAAPWLDAIAATLAQHDPANAATYSANADAAKTEIAALDSALAAELAPIKDKGFVTYHDAYRYFAQHYGLAYMGAVTLGDATTAGASHLRDLQAKMGQDVVCVFAEVQHDPDMLLQLTVGSAAKSGRPLDPEGTMLDPAPSNYTQVLRQMASALTDCLAGA